MLEYLKKQSNETLTENGAVTNASTNSDCLDFFSTVGAIRNAEKEEILNRFIRAYAENPDIAMKTLFFARDVRGGLGERHVFRIIVNWLAKNKPQSVRKNIESIAEYGRYDDLLALLGTKCEKDAIEYIKKQLDADCQNLEQGENVSLLAKWLPSVNASNADTVRNAKKLCHALNMTEAAYRKMLVRLRKKIQIIENNLREKDYSFDYEKQPSKALYKYRAAFLRNDKERYNEFLRKVNSGEAVMHTGSLAPYELVEPFIQKFYRYGRSLKEVTEEELTVLNTTWNALPNYCDSRNAIAVIDTSGSMYTQLNPSPASVALSLGLYFAERNTGVFKNHFIMFSEKPRLIELKGQKFTDKLRYVMTFNEVANTNIEAVFDLVLRAAVKNHVPQSEMPEQLVIISDMEFDRCAKNSDLSNFENAKRKYKHAGYQLPQIVFWNVASRNLQQPVTMNEQGVMLVSGCTPKLFSMIAGMTTPYEFMLSVLNSERYVKITA